MARPNMSMLDIIAQHEEIAELRKRNPASQFPQLFVESGPDQQLVLRPREEYLDDVDAFASLITGLPLQRPRPGMPVLDDELLRKINTARLKAMRELETRTLWSRLRLVPGYVWDYWLEHMSLETERITVQRLVKFGFVATCTVGAIAIGWNAFQGVSHACDNTGVRNFSAGIAWFRGGGIPSPRYDFCLTQAKRPSAVGFRQPLLHPTFLRMQSDMRQAKERAQNVRQQLLDEERLFEKDALRDSAKQTIQELDDGRIDVEKLLGRLDDFVASVRRNRKTLSWTSGWTRNSITIAPSHQNIVQLAMKLDSDCNTLLSTLKRLEATLRKSQARFTTKCTPFSYISWLYPFGSLVEGRCITDFGIHIGTLRNLVSDVQRTTDYVKEVRGTARSVVVILEPLITPGAFGIEDKIDQVARTFAGVGL